MSSESSPTLSQIATQAGVDRSTVSLALRNDPRLKPDTCKRIQSLAAKMGYRQNPTVAQLMSLLRAGQKHHFRSTIAVLNLGVKTVATNQILTGAELRAKSLGYGFEIFDAQDFAAQRLERILINRGIRGLFAVSQMYGNRLPDEYQTLWTKFSCCFVGTHPVNPSLHFVADDNYSTAMTAVQHLHRLGFRRIGLAMHRGINVETEYRFVGGYLAGYSLWPKLASLPIVFLEEGDHSRELMLSWYKQERPDVVICIQPEPLEWLTAEGFRVPEDVSLVNLDVGPGGKNWAGMQQEKFDLGAVAVDVIVTQINHNDIGIPASQRATLIESTWISGATLKAHSQS